MKYSLRLKKNKPKIEDKIIALTRYLNLEHNSFEGFMDWILFLIKELSIPHTLKELINDNSKFDEMSKMALNDPSTGGNPTKLSSGDFLELYKNAFEGIL